jgi:uncharacterized membrane protein
LYTTEVKFGPLLGAGSLIGLGMGGFLDGIIFHQILQLHSMISGKVYPDTLIKLEFNMFWGGVFHLFTWFTIAVGLGLLWKSFLNPYSPRSTPAFSGSLIMGWGLFNTVEGTINHILLGVHHLMEQAPIEEKLFWDMLYIGIGIIMIGIGRIMVSRGKREFFSEEIKKARSRPFKFKPAFHRRTFPQIEREDRIQ